MTFSSQQTREESGIPAAVAANPDQTKGKCRERTATIVDKYGDVLFNFGNDNQLWARTPALRPDVLLTGDGTVHVQVYRRDELFDEGHFTIDQKQGLITVGGFSRCFQTMGNDPVPRIVATHLQRGDRIVLLDVHDGFYGRLRGGKISPEEKAKTFVMSAESMADRKQARARARN